jgi:hypothetical protein
VTRARRECSNLIGLLRQSADIRDPGPCRDGVDGLVHSLQTADRARALGLDDRSIAVALLHDAAKPLTETYHEVATADLVREYATKDELAYLRAHSPWKFLEGDPTPLVTCDRLSFDPGYPTPYLEEMVPYLERFYGLARPCCGGKTRSCGWRSCRCGPTSPHTGQQPKALKRRRQRKSETRRRGVRLLHL